jgi:hypothetical protein
MSGTQVTSPDGSWFVFADWQGVTRIALPGDKVKTDAHLDRPHEERPLVLQPSGHIWSTYATDLDPVSLKKVSPASRGHESPDPLGGPELVVTSESVSVRGVVLPLVASGEELRLGGVGARRVTFFWKDYDVRPDGSIVAFGGGEVPHAALVVRAADGAGQVAWCRPVALVSGGAPAAFREGATTWLVDRDTLEDIATLVELRDDGALVSEQRAPAVAGPWVLDGVVWWQPSEATLCAGPRLGEPTETHALSEPHVGRGQLLALTGRKLFLPWHRTSLLDLAPTKKGKAEISRKHKATDEPIYREAERLLRVFVPALARRGARIEWRGCTRSGKRIEPRFVIIGPSDIVTFVLGSAAQQGGGAVLKRVGVTSVTGNGGSNFSDIYAPTAPTTAKDLEEVVAILDAAGISRAVGLPRLHWLSADAAQRGVPMPLTPEAEEYALAAVLSGLRGETAGAVPAATPEAFAAAAPLLRDYDRLREAGADASEVGLFLTIAGHRRFGADAVAPMRAAVIALSAHHEADIQKALGQPVIPYVPPVAVEAPLTPEEAKVVAALEAALRGLGLDPAECREGRGWYRYELGGREFQSGLHDDVRVQGTLCATETDVDLRRLGASLKRANKGLLGVRFEEADCYLHARSACAHLEATEERLSSMIAACRGALESDAGRELRATYMTSD